MPEHNIVFVEEGEEDLKIATKLSEPMTRAWLKGLKKTLAGIENYKVETLDGEGRVLIEETATHFLEEMAR